MKLKRFHKITAAALAFLLLPTLPVTAFATTTQYEDAHTIVLSSEENSDGTYTNTATYDGEDVKEYDYTWGIDLTEAHDDVSNSPAEYYSGEEPTGEESVYIAHDIYYYPELDESGFVLQNYDGEQEWCYYYTIEGYEDYIFSTLPVSGSSIPTQMMHSAEDAYQNSVLHITEAGTYILEGEWHGQIWIDLGDDAFDDETCKVNIILNGVDVTCTVAPSLVFANVYECDNTWEDQTSWSYDVDTTEAGANVIIADDTENNFSGTNIFRVLKTKFKSSDDTSTGAAQKKRLKIDGAFYSYMSMNIDGETDDSGVLNIEAGYEGLDTELHLTFNGGNVNITSGDDGINVNEDGVSVIAVNDGSLHIVAGTANEGDGIDSNGYLVINGGTVITTANPNSDSGMDSDSGSYVNGGYVVATGSTMDSVNSNSSQVTVDLQFASSQGDDEAIIFTDTDGNVVFAYDPDNDEVSGSNNRSYSGAIVSCPEFEEGATYYVYVGGDVYGTDVSGLYDVTTVTGFSDEAVQQCYTG
ncbi:MAG: carbohydrate-binding domain-containing protein, partial [Clostridiales bacterium]|nr:carbohydrate-binding domain-containing protein [Clostridiales bacterium]